MVIWSFWAPWSLNGRDLDKWKQQLLNGIFAKFRFPWLHQWWATDIQTRPDLPTNCQRQVSWKSMDILQLFPAIAKDQVLTLMQQDGGLIADWLAISSICYLNSLLCSMVANWPDPARIPVSTKCPVSLDRGMLHGQIFADSGLRSQPWCHINRV